MAKTSAATATSAYILASRVYQISRGASASRMAAVVAARRLKPRFRARTNTNATLSSEASAEGSRAAHSPAPSVLSAPRRIT